MVARLARDPGRWGHHQATARGRSRHGPGTVDRQRLRRAVTWGPPGILFGLKGKVVLVRPADGRVLREFGPLPIGELGLASDGRSLIAKRPNGRLALLDPATGAAREWTDPV
jgi:hypothetical protein